MLIGSLVPPGPDITLAFPIDIGYLAEPREARTIMSNIDGLFCYMYEWNGLIPGRTRKDGVLFAIWRKGWFISRTVFFFSCKMYGWVGVFEGGFRWGFFLTNFYLMSRQIRVDRFSKMRKMGFCVRDFRGLMDIFLFFTPQSFIHVHVRKIRFVCYFPQQSRHLPFPVSHLPKPPLFPILHNTPYPRPKTQDPSFSSKKNKKRGPNKPGFMWDWLFPFHFFFQFPSLPI